MRPTSRAAPPGRPARRTPSSARIPKRPPHHLPTRSAEPAVALDETWPDSEALPAPPPRRPRRGRLVLLAVVAVAVLLLLLMVALVDRALRGAETEPRTTVPPDPPGALPRPGSLVASKVHLDGTVTVTQWMRSSQGVDEVTLSVPTPAGGTGSARATGVRLVAADGSVVADHLTVGSEPRQVRLDQPTRLVRATYVLRGAVDASSTVDGRLRAEVVSLDLDVTPERGPSVVRVSAVPAGGVVGNLACANARSAVGLFRPCGTPDGASWTVRLPPESSEDLVTAQVDFP